MSDKVEYIYVDTDREAQKAVDYLSTFDRLGYDTETTGLDIVKNKVRLLLMQLGTEEVAYLFDPRRCFPNHTQASGIYPTTVAGS